MGSILGIDISKDSLDVVLISGNRQVHKVFNNNSVGHKHLHNWLVAHAGRHMPAWKRPGSTEKQ